MAIWGCSHLASAPNGFSPEWLQPQMAIAPNGYSSKWLEPQMGQADTISQPPLIRLLEGTFPSPAHFHPGYVYFATMSTRTLAERDLQHNENTKKFKT